MPVYKRAQELGFVAVVDEFLEPRLRRSPIGLDAQFLLDPGQERQGRLSHVFESRLAADRRQRFFQVEASTGPIAGGRGDPGTVKELLPLVLR